MWGQRLETKGQVCTVDGEDGLKWGSKNIGIIATEIRNFGLKRLC